MVRPSRHIRQLQQETNEGNAKVNSTSTTRTRDVVERRTYWPCQARSADGTARLARCDCGCFAWHHDEQTQRTARYAQHTPGVQCTHTHTHSTQCMPTPTHVRSLSSVTTRPLMGGRSKDEHTNKLAGQYSKPSSTYQPTNLLCESPGPRCLVFLRSSGCAASCDACACIQGRRNATTRTRTTNSNANAG